jgi:hypothetical protein
VILGVLALVGLAALIVLWEPDRHYRRRFHALDAYKVRGAETIGDYDAGPESWAALLERLRG